MKKIIIALCVMSLIFSNYTTANAKAIQNKSATTKTSAAKANKTNSNSDYSYEPTSSPWPKDGPTINSDAAIVMEASTGAILYAKNIHKTFYPASITKILTSLLTIENCSLSDTVTFSKKAIFDVELDSSRIGIDVGEKLTVEQSLYGVMLASANEVAYALAEHISGNVTSFAKLMNEKAKELGCVDSNFVNPHGLPDPNHYTSAYDMALISRAAINNSTFREITGTNTYVIPPTNIQTEKRYLTNHHKFIKNKNLYEGVIGGKTGYTIKSKYTLVTYAERDGMTLISVILHCDSITDEYADTASLLNYGFDNYTLYNIAEQEKPQSNDTSNLFTKYNPLFSSSSSNLQVSSSGNIVLPNTASYKDAKKEVKLSPITSLTKGKNVIGSINYSYKGLYCGSAEIIYDNNSTASYLEGSYVSTPTTSSDDKSANSASKKAMKLNPIVVFIVIIIVVIGVVFYIILFEIPYRKRRNAYRAKRRRRK